MTTKQRYEGIQTVMQNAGQSACLFLSLLSIAEDERSKDIDFISAYNTCRSKGLIDCEFYCKDQEAILNVLTGKNWKKKIVKTLPDPVPYNMYTIAKWYNPRTGYTHFRRRGYDTLANSITVKEGSIKEYYCYEVY